MLSQTQLRKISLFVKEKERRCKELSKSQLKKILFSIKKEKKRKIRHQAKMEKKKEAKSEVVDLCSDSSNSVDNENDGKSKRESEFADSFEHCMSEKSGNEDVNQIGMEIEPVLCSGSGIQPETDGEQIINNSVADSFYESCSTKSYLNFLRDILQKQPEPSSSAINQNEMVQQDIAFLLGIYENQHESLLRIDQNAIREESVSALKNYDSAKDIDDVSLSEDEEEECFSQDEDEEYSYYWIPGREYLERLNQSEDFTQDTFNNCSNFSCCSNVNSDFGIMEEEKIEDIPLENVLEEGRLEPMSNLTMEQELNFEKKELFNNGNSDFQGIAISQGKPEEVVETNTTEITHCDEPCDSLAITKRLSSGFEICSDPSKESQEEEETRKGEQLVGIEAVNRSNNLASAMLIEKPEEKNKASFQEPVKSCAGLAPFRREKSPIRFQIQPKAHPTSLEKIVGQELGPKIGNKNEVQNLKGVVLLARKKIEKMLEERGKKRRILINMVEQSKFIKKISTLQVSRNRKNSQQQMGKEEDNKYENSSDMTKKRGRSEDGNMNQIENPPKKDGKKDKNGNQSYSESSIPFYSEEEEEVGEEKDLKEVRKEVLEVKKKIEKSLKMERLKVKKIIKKQILKNKIEQSKLKLSQKIQKLSTLENPFQKPVENRIENLEEKPLEKTEVNDFSSKSEKSCKKTNSELPGMLKLVPYTGSSPVLVAYSDSSGDEKEEEKESNSSKIATEWEGLSIKDIISENEKRTASSMSISSNLSFSPGKTDVERSKRWRKRWRNGSISYESCEEGELVSESDYSEISETDLPCPEYPSPRWNTNRSRYSSIGTWSFSSSAKARSPSPRELEDIGTFTDSKFSPSRHSRGRILLTRPSRLSTPRCREAAVNADALSELSPKEEKEEDLFSSFAGAKPVKSPRSRYRGNGRNRGTSRGRYSPYESCRPEDKEPSSRDSKSRKSIKRLIETKKSTLEKQKRSISPEQKPQRKSRFESLPKSYAYSANPNVIISDLPKKKKYGEDLLKDMEMGKPEEDPELINEDDYDWDITPKREQTPSPEHRFIMIREEVDVREGTPEPENVELEPELENLENDPEKLECEPVMEEIVSSPKNPESNDCLVAASASEAPVQAEQTMDDDEREAEDEIEKKIRTATPPPPDMEKIEERNSKNEIPAPNFLLTNDSLEAFSKPPPLISKVSLIRPIPEMDKDVKEEEKVKRLEHKYLSIQKQVEEFQKELSCLKSQNPVEFPLPKILNDSSETFKGESIRSPSPENESITLSPRSEHGSECDHCSREKGDDAVKSKETEKGIGSKNNKNKKLKIKVKGKQKKKRKDRRKYESYKQEKRKREAEKRKKKEIEKRKRMERELDREIEKQRQIQRAWEKEIEREQERRREIERQMQKHIEMEKELEKQQEMERLIGRHREAERAREIERQQEIERLKELERQIEKEAEMQRLIQMEIELRRETQRQRLALSDMQMRNQLKIDLVEERQNGADNKIEVLISNRGKLAKPCTFVWKTHPAITKTTSGSQTLDSAQTLKVIDVQTLPEESSGGIFKGGSIAQNEENKLRSLPEGISQKDLEILEVLQKLDDLL